MAEIFCVPPKQIDMLWDAALPLLAQAMEYSNFDTVDDVLEALKTEKALLWIIHSGPEIDAAFVTQLKTYKHGKLCTIWALGGRDLSHWVHLHSEIAAFAKREGCERMVHELRPGFARVLMKKFGYRMTHATIEKAI